MFGLKACAEESGTGFGMVTSVNGCEDVGGGEVSSSSIILLLLGLGEVGGVLVG